MSLHDESSWLLPKSSPLQPPEDRASLVELALPFLTLTLYHGRVLRDSKVKPPIALKVLHSPAVAHLGIGSSGYFRILFTFS